MTPGMRELVKCAVEGIADEDFKKEALVPAPGGQVAPPPAADPAMAGGMPPMDPAMMGGAPPMDPAMAGGMPPMDPAMMGGAPMDPAMMGGAPPIDPAMIEGLLGGAEEAPAEEPAADVNDPLADQDNDAKPDVMVPLNAITDHDVKLIEATKGKKTQDAADKAGSPAEEPAPMDPLAAIGGAPIEPPAAGEAPMDPLAAIGGAPMGEAPKMATADRHAEIRNELK